MAAANYGIILSGILLEKITILPSVGVGLGGGYTHYSDKMLLCMNWKLCLHVIIIVIHPIHRFKSSDWLKEGHMTWIISDSVHAWKLIHIVLFLLYSSLTLEEAVTAAQFGTR